MKILVLLGTNDKPFDRLLKKIDEYAKENNLKDEIIVQSGFTKYESNNMKIFDLIPSDELDEYVKDTDLIITHGGVGSIMSGIRHNKKVIAVARLKEFKEHVNDHQIQIIENFTKEGYILELKKYDNLIDVINKSKYFKPKEFKSNNKNFVKAIEDYIDSF